jgi:hypothetical protein
MLTERPPPHAASSESHFRGNRPRSGGFFHEPCVVVAGILPAVCSGILPPGWKPDTTAARAGRRYRFMVPRRELRFVEAPHESPSPSGYHFA